MLSIIIPTLNEEKLLPGILNQLCSLDLQQKFRYEIIISDGGSTDSTIKIAESYKVRIVHEPKSLTKNIASGRNFGAKHANGDILMFINADILIDKPEIFLTYVIKDFGSSKNVALTCFVEIFPGENTFGDWVFHSFYNNYFFLINKFGLGMGRGECQVIRKHVFEQLCGYKEYLAAGEDFDLFKRAAKNGKILFLRKFKVFESPRRYRKYGYFKVAYSWSLNAFSILRSDKSNSDTWEQVR